MGHCAPSGRGQHGCDGDRGGAGTPGEAAADRDDRTNGSASSLAGAVRLEMRRRARSPSRRSPPDHPPVAWVNHDASLFLFFCAPAGGPSGRHASFCHQGSADSVRPRPEAPGDAPVRRNRCRSRSGRGRSGCKRPLRYRTSCKGTDGQTPARPVRRRRRGVDERLPWQDTRPAFVPVTVWGTAPGQNFQVIVGAVLSSILAGFRQLAEAPGASAIPRGNPTRIVSGPDLVPMRGSQTARRTAAGAATPQRAPHRIASGRDSRRQLSVR
jgi:hypothetical protein